MAEEKVISILDRLHAEETASKDSGKSSENDFEKYRLIGRLGDVLGSIFWLYAIIQVFIYDIDRYLRSTYFESHPFIVDYKFFLFLLIAFVVALITKRYFALFLYVSLFPLIFLLFKVPLFIYRFRSWIVFLAVVEAVSTLFYKLRQRIITTTLVLFSFLTIAILDEASILITSTLILLLILLFSVFRTIYISFKPSVFLGFQSKIIKKFRNSKFTKNMILIDEEVKENKSKMLTKEQSKSVIHGIQSALLLHRGIYFWAYQLEQYRRSKISFIFSGFSYIWLYAKVSVILTFINLALDKINPNNYEIIDVGSFIKFLYYSINSMLFSEVSVITATSNISIALRILSGVVGYFLLGVLVLNLFFYHRQAKNDDDLTEAIKTIKEEGEELDKQIREEYSVSTEEAIKKLQEVKAGAVDLVLKITAHLPKNFK